MTTKARLLRKKGRVRKEKTFNKESLTKKAIPSQGNKIKGNLKTRPLLTKATSTRQGLMKTIPSNFLQAFKRITNTWPKR